METKVEEALDRLRSNPLVSWRTPYKVPGVYIYDPRTHTYILGESQYGHGLVMRDYDAEHAVTPSTNMPGDGYFMDMEDKGIVQPRGNLQFWEEGVVRIIFYRDALNDPQYEDRAYRLLDLLEKCGFEVDIMPYKRMKGGGDLLGSNDFQKGFPPLMPNNRMAKYANAQIERGYELVDSAAAAWFDSGIPLATQYLEKALPFFQQGGLNGIAIEIQKLLEGIGQASSTEWLEKIPDSMKEYAYNFRFENLYNSLANQILLPLEKELGILHTDDHQTEEDFEYENATENDALDRKQKAYQDYGVDTRPPGQRKLIWESAFKYENWLDDEDIGGTAIPIGAVQDIFAVEYKLRTYMEEGKLRPGIFTNLAEQIDRCQNQISGQSMIKRMLEEAAMFGDDPEEMSKYAAYAWQDIMALIAKEITPFVQPTPSTPPNPEFNSVVGLKAQRTQVLPNGGALQVSVYGTVEYVVPIHDENMQVLNFVGVRPFDWVNDQWEKNNKNKIWWFVTDKSSTDGYVEDYDTQQRNERLKKYERKPGERLQWTSRTRTSSVKSYYIDPETKGIIDVSDGQYFNLNGYYINRVSVPESARGKGVATELFRQLLADADADGADLYLEINPYGDMNYDQLKGWYQTLGFKEDNPNWGGLFHRAPKGQAKIAMAERSGDPELDAAIEEYKQTDEFHEWESAHQHMGMDDAPDVPYKGVPLHELRYPEIAHGLCGDLAEDFADFLIHKGIHAYTSTEPFSVNPGDPGSTNGGNPVATMSLYPDTSVKPWMEGGSHTITHIEHNGQNYTVDWTAAQYQGTSDSYAFDEFPMVQRLGPDKQWQRHWSKFGRIKRGYYERGYYAAILNSKTGDLVIASNENQAHSDIAFEFVLGKDFEYPETREQEEMCRRWMSDAYRAIYNPTTNQLALLSGTMIGYEDSVKEAEKLAPLWIKAFKAHNMGTPRVYAYDMSGYDHFLAPLNQESGPIQRRQDPRTMMDPELAPGAKPWESDPYFDPKGYQRFKNKSLGITSMAEKTGDPKIDLLIEEFIKENPIIENYGAELDSFKYNEGKGDDEAQNSQGFCAMVANHFATWLKTKAPDLSVWVPYSNDYLDDTREFADPPHPLPEGESYLPPELDYMGYDDRRLEGNEWDETHTLVMIRSKTGLFSVDFAASQFGYKEWPMVQRVTPSFAWQRHW